MDKDEALKLALEALENHMGNYKLDDAGCDRQDRAITAIKKALAQPPMPVQPVQPVQEPVAYVTGMSFGRFIVEPLNPAIVLPIGMALYSSLQKNT